MTEYPPPPPGNYPPPASGGAIRPRLHLEVIPPPRGDTADSSPFRRAATTTSPSPSLICSVIGLFCGVGGAIVGIVLGIVAMNQIKKTGQAGHGLALAGVIVGAVSLVLSVVVSLVYFST